MTDDATRYLQKLIENKQDEEPTGQLLSLMMGNPKNAQRAVDEGKREASQTPEQKLASLMEQQ